MPRKTKARNPVLTLAAGMGPNGKRFIVKKPVVTSPSIALVTEEQQDAFCRTIEEHGGITPACRAAGMSASSVFSYANARPAFREMIDASLRAVHEAEVFRCKELCEELLAMDPKERMMSANAYGKVFEWSMRIIGKLSPKVYGDRPTNQTFVQTNNLVCDEETRSRLIALNQKLLGHKNDVDGEIVDEQ